MRCFLLILGILFSAESSFLAPPVPVETTAFIDLQQYLGTLYEFAVIPQMVSVASPTDEQKWSIRFSTQNSKSLLFIFWVGASCSVVTIGFWLWVKTILTLSLEHRAETRRARKITFLQA